MGLMEIRRRMLMASKNRLPNTTVQIAEYGYSWDRGRYNKLEDSNYGLSIFYTFQSSSSQQTIVSMGLSSEKIFILQADGKYEDWWGQTILPSGAGNDYWKEHETRRKCINAGTNEISCSIYLPLIDTTYAYIKESGDILFAGKNTPYYGYANINDMPT